MASRGHLPRFELALDALVRARPDRRETPGLKTLLAAEGKLDERAER